MLLVSMHTMLCAQAPTTPTRSVKTSGITGNSIRIDIEPGNGEKRLVFVKKASAVDAFPENNKNYLARAEFGTGQVLKGSNYVVYNGTGQSVTVSNLEPNTTYHFACFEYNQPSSPIYTQTAATASAQTLAGPIVPTQSAISADVEGNSLKIISTRGNGSRRLIILKKGSAPVAVPENGTRYPANPAFGSGFQIAPEEYIVHDSDENTASLTNLQPGTTYYFRIYEFDMDLAGYTYYLKDKYLSGQTSTSAEPSNNSQVTLAEVTGSSATLLFSSIAGKYRLILMRQGSPVSSEPVDLVRYTGGSKDYGVGAQLGSGNYLIAGSTNGNSFTIGNLKGGRTYYAEVFDFNGYYAPVYRTPGTVIKIEIPNEPTLPPTALGMQQVEGNSLRAVWTKGNGARRLVVARKNQAVTARPEDGLSYTANAIYGQGSALAEDEFVVYDGVEAGFSLKGLEPLSVYHLAVFEYNVPDKPDYLTSSFLSGFVSTIPYPTVQTGQITLKSAEPTRATIGFLKGNGERRMFVMRQDGVPAIDPQDFKRPDVSSNYGSAEIGPGNFAVFSTTSATEFTVNNLRPATTYHVNAYEFNGALQPAYLRPASTYSFTTPQQQDRPATDPVISERDGDRLRLSWTNGSGDGRMVIAREGSAPDFRPQNGKTYIANSRFGESEDLGNGQFAVFTSNSHSVLVTNLLPESGYYFAVYEFKGSGAGTIYQSEDFLIATGNTAQKPTHSSTEMIATSSANAIKLRWTSGNGDGRIAILKEGSAVTAIPQNLVSYNANSVFKSGSQISSGEFVVYAGTGSEVTVTGLDADKVYFYAVFERNGLHAPVYQEAASLSGSVKTSSPLPVRLLYFRAQRTHEGASLEWATTEETNSAYFVIESAFNPSSGFEAIDTVRSAGNSKELLRYRYAANAGSPRMCFRLKQVDLDGQYEYSRIVAISEQNAFTGLYPNPVTDKLYFGRDGDASFVRMSIYNLSGTLVKTAEIRDNEPADVAALPAGVYVVVAARGNAQYRQQIIKR